DLFGGDPSYTSRLIGDDGSLLASYPQPAESSHQLTGEPFLTDAIARSAQFGLVHGPDRVVAYRKLANYPVLVTVGRRWASVIGEWRATMAGHLIFGVPATLGLVALSVLAMRQWRRQHVTLAQLQDEVRRREVAEEALRQSQKMEA